MRVSSRLPDLPIRDWRQRVFRAATIVVLAIALLVTMKDGRALRDTGLLASCTAVAPPAGQHGYWEACRPGKLEGRPDLKRNSCESVGTSAGIEYWRCPSPVESAPAC
jgi:hypothetical protein